MIQTTDLIGTWRFMRDGRQAFLSFSHTQAFDYLEDEGGHQLLRLWYDLEEPDQIRFRTRPDESGWSCGIRISNHVLILSSDGLDTVCDRAQIADVPKWFVEELSRSKE